MIAPVKVAGIRSDRSDDYYNYHFRLARLEAGYSLSQLAYRAGVSIPTIRAYERLMSIPSPHVTRRLSRILGKKIHELFPKEIRLYTREINYERKHTTGRMISQDSLLQRIIASEASPEEDLLRAELSEIVNRVLDTLKERERDVLRLNFGIGNSDPLNYKQIGAVIGVSRQAATRIRRKALDKFKCRIVWILREEGYLA